jgi:hypothetical protein
MEKNPLGSEIRDKHPGLHNIGITDNTAWYRTGIYEGNHLVV